MFVSAPVAEIEGVPPGSVFVTVMAFTAWTIAFPVPLTKLLPVGEAVKCVEFTDEMTTA